MCRVLYTTTIMCCWIICPATRNRHGGELYIGAAVYSFCYPVIVAISLEKRYLYFSSFFVFTCTIPPLYCGTCFRDHYCGFQNHPMMYYYVNRWIQILLLFYCRTRKRFSSLLLFASYCFCWVKVWSGWWQPTTIVSRSTINSEGGRWTVYINTIVQKHQERDRERIYYSGCWLVGCVYMKAYGRASSQSSTSFTFFSPSFNAAASAHTIPPL